MGRPKKGSLETRAGAMRAPRGKSWDTDVVGRVIDLDYMEPVDVFTTFRVRVESFDPQTNLHRVNSEGYSICDDESFIDEVNLRMMYDIGQVTFVEERSPSLITAATSSVANPNSQQALQAD